MRFIFHPKTTHYNNDDKLLEDDLFIFWLEKQNTNNGGLLLCQDPQYIIDGSTDSNYFILVATLYILPQKYSVGEIPKKRNKHNN